MNRKRKLLAAAGISFIVFVVVAHYLSGSSEIVVLDKTVFREALDVLPASEKEAAAESNNLVLSYYNLSKKVFEKYFALINITRTEYRWIAVYGVEDNPEVYVYLVKNITSAEGFDIADKYIKTRVGQKYFEGHYQRKSFSNNTASYIFSINGSGAYSMEMWIQFDDERRVERKNVLLEPEEVKIKRENAAQKAISIGVPEPMQSALAFDGSRLVWRFTWKHKPTSEDYEKQSIYGADIDAENGGIRRLLRYIKQAVQKPANVSKAQVEELTKRIAVFKELSDGAIINLGINKGQSGEYAVIKSMGRLVIKEGLSGSPDITIWIDRDSFEKALESSEPIEYLIQESKKGKVSVKQNKNSAALAIKGYIRLYEKFQKG